MTKKQKQMLTQYNNSIIWHIKQAYKTYSTSKYHAYNYCTRLMASFNGYDGRVTSYNTFGFSFAFRYIDKDSKKEYLMYITPQNNYQFCIA